MYFEIFYPRNEYFDIFVFDDANFCFWPNLHRIKFEFIANTKARITYTYACDMEERFYVEETCNFSRCA